jgi:hypothetical protein
MASQENVKKYLAYWFQLGKKIVVNNETAILHPQPVLAGDRYSQEFENCWQQITLELAGNCHLEGTDQTISQLLTPEWEFLQCARCTMPVPMREIGMPALSCPCHDLLGWPNTELPLPHSPINTKERLSAIRDRISVP